MEYEIIGPTPTSLGLQPFGQVLKGALAHAGYVSIAVAYCQQGMTITYLQCKLKGDDA
jgi:hypothetical protein